MNPKEQSEEIIIWCDVDTILIEGEGIESEQEMKDWNENTEQGIGNSIL